MKDLSHISERQLLVDLQESEEDILICQMALAKGTTRYSGGSVQERLDANLQIIELIRGELGNRRRAAGGGAMKRVLCVSSLLAAADPRSEKKTVEQPHPSQAAVREPEKVSPPVVLVESEEVSP